MHWAYLGICSWARWFRCVAGADGSASFNKMGLQLRSSCSSRESSGRYASRNGTCSAQCSAGTVVPSATRIEHCEDQQAQRSATCPWSIRSSLGARALVHIRRLSGYGHASESSSGSADKVRHRRYAPALEVQQHAGSDSQRQAPLLAAQRGYWAAINQNAGRDGTDLWTR